MVRSRRNVLRFLLVGIIGASLFGLVASGNFRPSKARSSTLLQYTSTTLPIEGSIVTLNTPMRHLTLKGQTLNWITLDHEYLYWTTYQDPRHIFRYPQAGGTVETIISSRFEDGDLTTLHPARSGDWLIFLDTPARSGNTNWLVRALNLKDRTEQVVTEEAGDPTSWPGPWVDAYNDIVIWSRTGRAKDGSCIESIVAMRDLRNDEQYELERVCIEDNLMWNVPHIAGNKIVIERDLPDSKGSSNDVYLFDLISDHRTALTDNGHSSMPVISDFWIVWKDAPRYSFSQHNVIYNLQSNISKTISVPPDSLDPNLTSHWLYWQPSPDQPFYAYDIQTNQTLAIVTPSDHETIESVSVFENIVAWDRALDSDLGASKDSPLCHNV